MGTPVVTQASTSPANTQLTSHSGRLKFAIFNFTYSTSYATGGEAFDPTVSGNLPSNATIKMVIIPSAGGWTFAWDSSAKKILAYTTANTQVASGQNLSVTPGPLKVLVIW